METQLQLIEATDGDLPAVENLARFYVYDMSEFMGWPCPKSGLFGGCDEFFNEWRNGNNHPFVIRCGGRQRVSRTKASNEGCVNTYRKENHASVSRRF